MRTVLVTGGAGFIGSHVVDGYLETGCNVVAVDNLVTGRRQHLNPQARFYEMSILDPRLEEVLRIHSVDIVNHHAAQINVRSSVSKPAFDAEQNILGSLHLFASARRAGVGKLIYASSGGAIYGNPESLPAEESDTKQPLSPYGISKYSVELYLHFYRLTYRLNYLTLRYANVYGPRQDPEGEAGVVAIFSQKMSRGERPTIFGSGEQTRDYVYVKDVVAANLAATDYLEQTKDIRASSPDDFAFNVGTGEETSVNDLFHQLAVHAGFNRGAAYGPAREGEVERISLNPHRALTSLGWRPRTALTDGLRQTARSLGAVPTSS